MTAAETSRLDAMMAEVDDFDDLDAAYEEVRRKPYGFIWAGQKWVLPHLRDLDWRVQAQIEATDGMTYTEVDALFRRLFGPEQEARWDQVDQPGEKIEMFFARWLKHSGSKPGEDSASSGSSGSTGKSSRRTSGASTTSASRSRSSAKKAVPAKRTPRKPAKAAPVLTPDDQEWIARHQALAGSPPASSSA